MANNNNNSAPVASINTSNIKFLGKIRLPNNAFMIKNLPLFFGVEIILGFLIINKFNSIYGMLSLVTGHSLSAFQLFYYFSQFIVLVTYLNGLKMVHHPEVKFYCFLNVINIIDTFVLFFSMTVFNFSYNLGEKFIDPGNSTQAASRGYELFILFAMLMANVFIKVYSNFIILSFTREMLYNTKFSIDNHEEIINLSNLKNFNGGNAFLNFYKNRIEYTYELMKWRSYQYIKECFY